MADDTADLDLSNAPELETASPELDNLEDEVIDLDLEAEGQEGDEEGGGDEPEVGFVTLERNGKSYQVPKELEAEFLMQSDYTKKTQTLAEEKRALEQQRERVAQQALVSEQEMNARVALKAIDKQIEAYKGINWEDEFAKDRADGTNHASEAIAKLNQLREQRARGAEYIQQAEQQRTAAAARDFEERIAETKAFAAKEITGWTPELDKKITDFAVKDMGITPQFIEESINPLLYKILHRAYVGDQAMKRAASARAKPVNAAATPTRTVGARAAPRSSADLASADMEAYVAARQRGVGGKSPLRG